MATEHEAITTVLRGESLGEHRANLTGALYLIGVPVLILFLHYAEAVLVPIVLAVLIGYALDPVVTKLGRWCVPRAGAAMIVIIAVLAGLGGATYHLRHHFAAVLESLPETARRIRYTVENQLDDSQSSTALDKIKEAASEIQKTADAAAGQPGADRRRYQGRGPAAPKPRRRIFVDRVGQLCGYDHSGRSGGLPGVLLVSFRRFVQAESGPAGWWRLRKETGDRGNIARNRPAD